MTDNVNHPSHYVGRNGLEAVDVLKEFLTPEEFMGWCKGNALKYLLRAGRKNDVREDVAKAEKMCVFFQEVAGPFYMGVIAKGIPMGVMPIPREEEK